MATSTAVWTAVALAAGAGAALWAAATVAQAR